MVRFIIELKNAYKIEHLKTTLVLIGPSRLNLKYFQTEIHIRSKLGEIKKFANSRNQLRFIDRVLYFILF